MVVVFLVASAAGCFASIVLACKAGSLTASEAPMLPLMFAAGAVDTGVSTLTSVFASNVPVTSVFLVGWLLWNSPLSVPLSAAVIETTCSRSLLRVEDLRIIGTPALARLLLAFLLVGQYFLDRNRRVPWRLLFPADTVMVRFASDVRELYYCGQSGYNIIIVAL